MNPFAPLKTRLVVWIWKHTPTCAEMTRLTSVALERPLPLRARLRMRLHFVICVWCRRYFAQINFLRQASAQSAQRWEALAVRRLSPEARLRMMRRLAAET